MSLLDSYEDVATGDWARDYLFKVVFEPPTLILPLYPLDLDVFILNFKAPGSKVKVIKKDWAGQWSNFAGPLDSPGTTDFELQVDEAGRILTFLEAWRNLSGSDDNAASVPKRDFVGKAHITLYRTDKETPIQTVTLYNAFIPSTDDLALNKAGEGLLSVKASMAYDRRGTSYHR